MQFTCGCLNITISTNIVEPVDLSQLIAPVNDSFFKSKLIKVLSKWCNINLAQPSLCSKRQVGQFLISTCFCCDQDTYATNNDYVLISTTLEKDAKQIKELQESENYSKLYKLILPLSSSSNYSTSYELKQSKNLQTSGVVQVVWQQANAFLCQQQQEMEERIRIFTENQYAEYNDLQSRVMKEKQAFIDLLHCRSLSHAKMSLPLSLGQFPSPPTSPDNSEKAMDDNSITNTPVKVPSSAMATNIIKHRQELNVIRRRAQSIHSTHSTLSFDASIIFDMDGLEDDAAAFPMSDEEGDSDDSSGGSETRNRIPQKGMSKHRRSAYAKSCPIEVPLWTAIKQPKSSDDDEVELDQRNPSPDPQVIADSMHALAMSSRDEKQTFWDVPRRRLNTGDLVKSRPI